MEEVRFGPVVFLPGPNRGKYPHCHSLLIDAGVRAVVDPASDEAALKLIAAQGVEVVVHSHWHEDHIWLTDLFARAALWVPEADRDPYRSLDEFIRWYGMEEAEHVEEWRKTLLGMFRYRPREPQRLLRDGDRLDFGKTWAEVVHLPGHTPGHSGLFFPEQELMFLGDLDLTRFGPWYGDLYSDLDACLASVERVRKIPAKHYLACHEQGVFVAPIGELCDAYLAVAERRERALREFLAQPRTRAEIIGARIVYGRPREPKSYFDFGEWALMRKHLERMVRRGEAAEEGGVWRLTG